MKKVYKKMILIGGIPGTLKVWNYLGAPKVYKLSHQILRYSAVYIDHSAKDEIRMSVPGKKEAVIENPMICQMLQVAASNHIPVFYKDKKAVVPDDSIIISDNPIHMLRYSGKILYHSPLKTWRKMKRPQLTGMNGQIYEAIAAMELVSGRYKHSMYFTWAYLVLGPMFYMVLQNARRCKKHGKTLVLLCEEEHMLVDILRKRQCDVLNMPWNSSWENTSNCVLEKYTEKARKYENRIELFAFSEHDRESANQYISCEGTSFTEIMGVDEKKMYQTFQNMNGCQPHIVSMSEDEYIYKYTAVLPQNTYSIIQQGAEKFIDDMVTMETKIGQNTVFGRADFSTIIDYGNWYLSKM